MRGIIPPLNTAQNAMAQQISLLRAGYLKGRIIHI